MNKDYKRVYDFALKHKFRVNYIKSINRGSFFKLSIYKYGYQFNISSFTLNDLINDIEEIYLNLEDEITLKDEKIDKRLNELLKDYSHSMLDTGGNENQLNKLKEYLFTTQDYELIGLNNLKERLKKFDYTAVFSDSFGTSSFWDYKDTEIRILIDLLKPVYKSLIKDYIIKYNLNEHGTKFYV